MARCASMKHRPEFRHKRSCKAIRVRLLYLALAEAVCQRGIHMARHKKGHQVEGMDANSKSGCCFRTISRQYAPAYSTLLLPIPSTTLSRRLLGLRSLAWYTTNSIRVSVRPCHTTLSLRSLRLPSSTLSITPAPYHRYVIQGYKLRRKPKAARPLH